MKAELPRSVQLPSGRVVELQKKAGLSPKAPQEGSLFSEVIDLFESGDITMRSDGAPLTVYALELRDFHALRAILTCAGLLSEEPVEIQCRNCDTLITHAPCAELPLGPFADKELDDPELDTTLELGVPHEIPSIPLGRARQAHDVTLSPRTVDDAFPLFRALGQEALVLTSEVVRAMGVCELGPEKNPARIARALAAASEEAWTAVTDLYLFAHYAPRLFSIALCPKCGARNDVDAPYDREFLPGGAEARPASDKGGFPDLPAFDPFAERARAIANEAFLAEQLDDVSLVVEGGIPAVDDGGEPLMGAYVPGSPGDMGSPSRPHEITVYYRTFRAIWDEDGPFDWDAELKETILHELEHHLAFLAGDDPMDDEERAEIGGEALRVLGKRAVVREGVTSLAKDALDFLRKTWIVWLVLAIATVAITMTR